MNNQTLYADVILPFPISGYFTYSVPTEYIELATTGKRAVVQFGAKKLYTAIIAKLHNKKPDEYITKDIISIIDESPVVSELQLNFWSWVSEYYMCTIGEVMKAALPAGLKLESETHVYYNHSFDSFEELSETELLVLDLIRNNPSIGINGITTHTAHKNILVLVKSLLDKGAVMLEESLKKGFSAKTITYVRLTEQAKNEEWLSSEIDKLKKAPKQHDLIHSFIRLSGIFESTGLAEVSKKVLLESCEATSSVLKSLITKNILEVYTNEISRLNNPERLTKDIKSLNSAQLNALAEIEQNFKSKNVVLLHGVTSSGKTEVYIHLIQKMIDEGKQVLYLLPEIAITAQIINRLKVHFGTKVGVYHSKFSDNERVEIWNSLNNGLNEGYSVILGVRSSIFLPFKNLGLIIVDEEHETSFKQYDPAPRYNARDCAIMLATLHNAKILLGTATPSVETYYNAKNNKYELVELTERYQGIKLPEIKLVNMRAARKNGHVNSHFSKELLENIELQLEQSKQVILFQNRRGFAPYLECKACGWIPKCKHCDVTLTYHKLQNQLVCHYCGFVLKVPHKCGECGHADVQTMGFGTEKIEEELSFIFPKAKISRMDLDSTRSKYAYEEIISDFENMHIDILVGTQMVTKGLDFANVGLVGILNADNMLNFPDFRAFERSYQLITQVSGRAGRKEKQGLVVIQTNTPGHPIVKNVLANDFIGMYNTQIEEREQFHYPPLFRLIQITIKHKELNVCEKLAETIANDLKQFMGKRVLGPDIPLIGRIQSLYLRTMLLKIERNAPIAQIKIKILEIIKNAQTTYKSSQVSIDVDPL